jgi:hypothetical protein
MQEQNTVPKRRREPEPDEEKPTAPAQPPSLPPPPPGGAAVLRPTNRQQLVDPVAPEEDAASDAGAYAPTVAYDDVQSPHDLDASDEEEQPLELTTGPGPDLPPAPPGGAAIASAPEHEPLLPISSGEADFDDDWPTWAVSDSKKKRPLEDDEPPHVGLKSSSSSSSKRLSTPKLANQDLW